MRVAICDDDKESCAGLRQLIKSRKRDCEVKCFYSCGQFLKAGQHFDILLLDVQMEAMKGMEAARALRRGREDTLLIIVTAGKEYAAEAFEVSAFHYLLKPVDTEKFGRVFESACREVRRLEHLRDGQLFFRTRAKSFTLRKSEILYVESAGRKVIIHTDKENIAIYATMKSMEALLKEDFGRCHRGYLVNLARVAEYGAGSVRLQNGESVWMAREKYSEFVRVYTEYLRQGRTTPVWPEKKDEK